MSFFRNIGLAFKVLPVIGIALEALADGKITAGEALNLAKVGFSQFGVDLDTEGLHIQQLNDGGIQLTLDKKIVDQLKFTIAEQP